MADWITPEMARKSLKLMQEAAEVRERFARIAERNAELQEVLDKERADAEAFFEGVQWTPEQIAAIKQHNAHVRAAAVAAKLTTGICVRSAGCLCEKDGSVKEGCSCWAVAQTNPHPIQQGEARNNFPPLTFKPEEWRMKVRNLPQPEKNRLLRGDFDDAPDIMSAVRDIARGG